MRLLSWIVHCINLFLLYCFGQIYKIIHCLNHEVIYIDGANWHLTSQPCLCTNHHSTWAHIYIYMSDWCHETHVHWWYWVRAPIPLMIFNPIQNSMKFHNAFVRNMFSWSQWHFAHFITVLLDFSVELIFKYVIQFIKERKYILM